MQHRSVAARSIGLAESRIAAAAVWIGCCAVASISMSTVASAHVKWLVTCDASDDPLPLQAVFTGTFWLFLALFVALFYVVCVIEDTCVGAFLSGALDRWTASLRQRADVLLRASAAVSFAVLWTDGSTILTPDLRDNHAWLSTLQVLIAIYVAARATLPAAAVAILVLYGYGVATYGLFHMLDYPFFLGLSAYFALSVSKNFRLGSFRLDCLRWTAALSLMWPSMENFLYPNWVASVAMAHPQLTFGLDVATFTTAVGSAEFGLAFALFWTPLVRRLAAAVLALLLFAVTLDLGKMVGVSHLMLVAILLLVFADPGRKQAFCRPIVAPIVGGTALLALIFIYTGVHALCYGPSDAALIPLMTAASLLMVGLLCLRRPSITALDAASAVGRIVGPERRRITRDQAGMLALEPPPREPMPRRMTRYESFVARLQAASPPPDRSANPADT
jgi:hypothetical protein